MGRRLRNLLASLFPGDPKYPEIADRSVYERFAIPFAFKPRLSVLEAAVAAIAMFLRIVLGCLLFAVWGAYSLLVWCYVDNVFWRFALLLPMLAAFLIALALLLLTITALTRVFIPTKSSSV